MGATAWQCPLFPVVGDLLAQLSQQLKLLLLQLLDQGRVNTFHHILIVEQVDAQEVQASLRPGSVYQVQLLLAILAMVVLGRLYRHPFVLRDGVQQLLQVELAGTITNTLKNKKTGHWGVARLGYPR